MEWSTCVGFSELLYGLPALLFAKLVDEFRVHLAQRCLDVQMLHLINLFIDTLAIAIGLS